MVIVSSLSSRYISAVRYNQANNSSLPVADAAMTPFHALAKSISDPFLATRISTFAASGSSDATWICKATCWDSHLEAHAWMKASGGRTDCREG